MTSTTLIGATLASPTFTTSTAKVTWTPTATSFYKALATATDNPMVAKIEIFLWGSAADKTADEPYKTMNTWYTTNKAAIDSQSLASTTQVSSWALHMKIATNVASTVLQPATVITKATGVGTTTQGTPETDCVTSYCPPAGTYGDAFMIWMKNKTTSAAPTALVWGNIVTTGAVMPNGGTAVPQAAAV